MFIFFFFSSRRRHTRSVSAFLLNRSSDLRFAWSTPQRQKLKFLPLRRYNLTLNLLSRSHDWIASGRQIAINGHIKFNLTIPLQQLNGLETLVIIMVANKYAFLQITRRRFLNEWEAFKKVISRRNIRRRITIPLTLSNLKLLRRITRTENILHRNFTRRQVAIQNRVASNIGISQSTFSVKVLNHFSRSRRKTNKRKSKHSAMLRNKETRHRMFIGLLNTARKLAYRRLVSSITIIPTGPEIRAHDK